MYESYSWPGAYSFKGEIKLFVSWFKEQVDCLLKKIEDTEQMLR